VTSGISGGGGYTGSPGDGVSGATCYADPTVTMTDLGAASNSAGYVTVSLIDPPPLKQTWSWSPNFVDTTLRGPWQNVNWSDELQQFLSIMGTSDDGLNWNNAATLLGIFTGVYPTNPVFCTAYSPSLGIYVGIGFDFSVFQVFFRYSYDKVTWQNSATNATSNNGKIIWSKDFNLFIAIDGTKIYSSDDGINWTQRYSGFYSIYQIVYSSSIPRVVTNVAYSDDGINWTSYVSKWDTVSWSPTLALFFATTSTSCKYSSDGITWSSSGVNLPTANWRTSIWSEQNSLFSILSSTQAAYSSDGLYWGVTSHEASTTIYDVAFSPANGVYVVAGELSEGYLVSIGGIYWVKPVPVEPVTRVAAWAPDKGIILMSDVASYKSSDGISWNLSISKEFFNIIYSDGLGIFVCTEYPQGNVYYSYDGSNFVDSNFTFSSTLYQKKRITWSKQLGMFSGKAYSRDGINWTFSSIDALSVVWCPEQKRFVALANIGGNNPTSTNSYYSSDGINWTYGSNLGTVYEIITQMAWSPTLHRFVVACKIYNTSNYVNLYSNDGINWSQSISINGLPPSLFWIPELQIFMSTGIYSYDGINWINVSIPSFLPIIWTPELKKIVCEAGYSEVTKTF
jgi:hypothetical protein